VKRPDGRTETVWEEKGRVPLPPWPTFPADALRLRKLQFEQLQEGRAYLELGHPRRFRLVDFIDTRKLAYDYAAMIGQLYRLAADMDEKPAGRIPWYQARVREFKALERSTAIRVMNGNDPPLRLNQARFERLRTEAELLALTATPAPAPAKPEAATLPLFSTPPVYPPPCIPPRGGPLGRPFRRW
jgi:hypothetical protein